MNWDIKNKIQKLVTSVVADAALDQVRTHQPVDPNVMGAPIVSGWKQHRSPNGEPSWSCPPWSGQAERDYESKMAAIAFSLRHQVLEHDRAVLEHRKAGEAMEFVSRVLPGDVQALPASIAAHARRLLKAEGWM